MTLNTKEASKVESKRSMKTPWPGKRFEKSLIPCFLFKNDASKSPSCPVMEMITPTRTTHAMGRPSNMAVCTAKRLAKGTAIKVPPTAPSTVFFGDMEGESLCFPIASPTKYANESVSITVSKTYTNTATPLDWRCESAAMGNPI